MVTCVKLTNGYEDSVEISYFVRFLRQCCLVCRCVCLVKMSESEEEFMCSQVVNNSMDMNATQSGDYGGDIVDNEDEGIGNVVSLENGNISDKTQCEVVESSRRIVYDNVEIEDISSDEELDKM